MVEQKDHQQQEVEGKLQFHSRLTLRAQSLTFLVRIRCVFASLKVCNLKICM